MSNRSLSAFIADAVREVLARSSQSDPPEAIRLVTVKGELMPGINYDSFAELIDRVEGLE